MDAVNKSFDRQHLQALTSLYNIKWINNHTFWVDNKEAIVVYNIDSKKIEYFLSYPKNAKHIHFNDKASAIVYLEGYDLYISQLNREPVKIENGSKEGIVLGQAVHRSEFGIVDGIFWSPTGNSVAFYRMDETMVTDYPLVNINRRVAQTENIKYPMAGMKSHEVTVGVYDLDTGDLVYMQTGEPKEKYLTNVAWSGDEQNILIAVLNRAQNHMKMEVYDSKTGHFVKELFEEKSDTWVEPENPALFLPASPNQFVWQSERDGYNHLYLYDINKGLKKQLTAGQWVVTSVLGLDIKSKYLFFEATKDGGVLNRHLYKVSLSNGRISRITSEMGTHVTSVSKSGNRVIDMYSNLETPRIIQLLDVKKRSSVQLHEAKDPFLGYRMGRIVMDTIKAADGKTDLYSRMILPPDFDASKKYPVVVYVYGGPHAQLVKNSWLGAARMWQLYMAQQGYIAFTMDNRGTPDRGCEFEKVIHRQLGEVEAADQMQGVKYLQSLPYVDENRIGVHGWSFGGFMTINLMEKYPDVFKVGVSGGPVTDWKYYEIMYGERYMDLPEENKKGYEMTNLNMRTKNLKGRLLVIHGAIDPTVVWQHSLYFIEQCIKNRKQVDYFVYPRHEHNVRGADRVHLMQKVTNYFNDFL
ncbi:prolyl tripeptidyl peptidase precursor [Saccharicrinis fermentans DSM 9555 = JCM 21142]|uniref:Prolyl tripeptidyl peptidase n=1 Tax=Saccharicrinis fermentans DSM 9555 = JCM 21142 TaxID=869213 RepID=W7Y053_9BACT|nr:prolyl tripeptidyl peptidase precursor [Saccharicrinis fermentans DSM 9555 = JCM 21142]